MPPVAAPARTERPQPAGAAGFGRRRSTITAPASLSRAAPLVGEGQSGRVLYAAIAAPRGFRPGDFVTVRITEPPLAGVAMVPAAAVDAEGGILLLGPEDRLQAATVEVVRRQGDMMLIRAEGIAGREIVAARSPLLGEGVRVRPQREPGAGATLAAPAPDLVSLEPERRAALIARVEGNTQMPEPVRNRILAQLSQEQVPARLIERIEQGGTRPQGG